MNKKYLENDDLRLKEENYWWSRINLIINNIIMKNQKIIKL